MSRKNMRLGGFAAQNTGEIDNCYSVLHIAAKKEKAVGGFVGENSGKIRKSYSYCKINKLGGGFSGQETSKQNEDCYFLHSEREGSKKLSRLWDSDRGQRLKELEETENLAELGLDTEEIWELSDKKAPIQFIPEKWMVDVEEIIAAGGDKEFHRRSEAVLSDGEDFFHRGGVILEKAAEEIPPALEIKTAAELLDFAEKINDGDQSLANAYVKITEDIDLSGKEWRPIGSDRMNAFKGIFDGGGHTIRNFVIKDKKIENKGFFGFLRGCVYNLTVDAYIKGGLCSGGIAAQNLGGVIRCCAAIIELKGKAGNMGGLVGCNHGIISQSYAAGKIILIIIPFWRGLPGLALLLLVPVAVEYFPGDFFDVDVFAPVPYDEDAVPTPGETISPNTDSNFVSFQFEQEITVSLETGLCAFSFKNPGNSNHDIVVQLHFTDAQAKRVMGSTGRNAEEQARLESAGSYDPETYRTVIAQSGAIPPGYQLADLRLTAHENGATLPPGDYNAIVYLIFYDIDTHNRAMLESQLPVVISVS